MKHHKTLLLFLLLCLTCIAGYPDTSNIPSPTPEKQEDIIILVPAPAPNKPNSLTETDNIICYIRGNKIEFCLPDNIFSATVSIYSGFQGCIGYITLEENIIEIPFSSKYYTIECMTCDGILYKGQLKQD